MPRILKVYITARLAEDFRARTAADPSKACTAAGFPSVAGWHAFNPALGRRMIEDARVRAFDATLSVPQPLRLVYRAFYYQLQRRLADFGELSDDDCTITDLRCLVRVWVRS